MTTYEIRKDHDGRRDVYYIVDTRNPHIAQHAGFFSSRARARLAMMSLCWGETITGDID